MPTVSVRSSYLQHQGKGFARTAFNQRRRRPATPVGRWHLNCHRGRAGDDHHIITPLPFDCVQSCALVIDYIITSLLNLTGSRNVLSMLKMWP